MSTAGRGLRTGALRHEKGRRVKLPGIANEAVIATAAFLIVWQVASLFANPILVPSPLRVAREVWLIVTTPLLQESVATSYVRVLEGLAGGFVIGSAVAMLMTVHPRVAAFVTTYLSFIQGVPSLCWVVMAIIWFRDVELRIWFILVMVTLPGFTLQIYDGWRSIPPELKEMVRSLRPNPLHRFRYLVVPALLAPILTIWKISLGLGIRVVLVAELVGGTLGIGFQLQGAEAAINMALVLAWTFLLVVFVLVSEKLLSLLERRALRWRPEESPTRSTLEILATVESEAA